MVMGCNENHQPGERFYFGSNFKMHKTFAEVKTFLQFLSQEHQTQPGLQLFVIPPFTSLGGLQDVERPDCLWVGAQNMHWAAAGPYTGEISAGMLSDLKVDLVMLGHAERRHKFGETDTDLHKKVQSAINHQLRILLCVGETAEQREYGITPEILAMQLKVALHDYPIDKLDGLMVAYEPVWAIGAGSQEATPGDISASIRQIKQTLHHIFGDAASHVPVLYGGSVNKDNCGAYVQHTPIDGLFVGRSAWQPEGFMEVLQAALVARQNVQALFDTHAL